MDQKKKIEDYISEHQFEKIVLLEDFVGSGNQIKKVIEYAASTFSNIDFLVIPIVMCPQAHDLLDPLMATHRNVAIRPVLELNIDGFVKKTIAENHDSELKLKSLFQIAQDSDQIMKQNGFKIDFRGYNEIGGLIILYTNTPNNSLPILWSDTNWNPLFKRHTR